MEPACDPSIEIVYLDHAATTPLRREAREAMDPYHDAVFANPSGSHRMARAARLAVDEARDRVAAVIGCRASEVVFTSGGTEGANAAILGSARGSGGTAICPAAEHHAVLDCVRHLGGVVVPVDDRGAVEIGALAEAVDGTGTGGLAVVSVMTVNNEVGTVSDIAAVAETVRRRAPGAALHTDAVQAACWTDLRDVWRSVDLLSLSAHKFGGPKGVGVLVVRSGRAIEPLLHGGGQESARRSGTHNVAGIVGTAVALEATDEERATVAPKVLALRERLIEGILAAVPEAVRTVPGESAVPGVAHLCLEGMENESLLFLLDRAGICASAASACASGAMEPSHVLAAMGVASPRAKGSLRFSLGHGTSEADVDAAVAAVASAADRVRTAGRVRGTGAPA